MCRPILMSTTDWEKELGGEIWRQDGHGNKVLVTIARSNHLILIDSEPVMYCENFGRKLWRLAKIPQDSMCACIQQVKSLLRENPASQDPVQIRIEQINNQPATHCKLAKAFLRNGFETDGDKLVLRAI